MNFGHSTPPIRMSKIYLNDVECCGGLAAVDTYIGATQPGEKTGIEYGGAHVICDLIDGKDVLLKAYSPGTDCYPRKELRTYININEMNEAYLYNPRNCYQNYGAAINTSSKRLYTYMGILQPNGQNLSLIHIFSVTFLLMISRILWLPASGANVRAPGRCFLSCFIMSIFDLSILSEGKLTAIL